MDILELKFQDYIIKDNYFKLKFWNDYFLLSDNNECTTLNQVLANIFNICVNEFHKKIHAIEGSFDYKYDKKVKFI